MKEAIVIDLEGNDTYKRTLVADHVTGVFPIMEPVIQSDELEPVEAQEEPNEPEMITVGYTVAVPVPAGLYRLRYDLEAWQAAIEQYEKDMEAWRQEMQRRAEDDEEDEEIEYLPPPAAPDLSSFWVEGYTPEELEELLNPPPGPPSPEERIEALETENADLWYDTMLKDARLSEHDNDIADIWYEIMTGGAV